MEIKFIEASTMREAAMSLYLMEADIELVSSCNVKELTSAFKHINSNMEKLGDNNSTSAELCRSFIYREAMIVEQEHGRIL